MRFRITRRYPLFWALGALLMGAFGTPAVAQETTTVLMADNDTLHYDFHPEQGTMTTHLEIEPDLWLPLTGSVLALLEPDTTSPAVFARFQPPAFGAFRMCFRPDTEVRWACTAWTTGEIIYTMASPAVGEEHGYAYYADVLPSRGAPTIATHGYIKIKKLNTGG